MLILKNVVLSMLINYLMYAILNMAYIKELVSMDKITFVSISLYSAAMQLQLQFQLMK